MISNNTRTRSILISVFIMAAITVLLVIWGRPAAAQSDPPAGPDKPDTATAPLQVVESPVTITAEDVYTVWRKEINSGCSFSDHNYTLDIPEDPENMSDIRFTMSNYDVDYASPGCPGGPEVDNMYLNGNLLGRLTGADNSWSINAWDITKDKLVQGSNTIYIDTDATNTGCWCVGVGYIEVRAIVGFKVLEYTPQANDKHRDFHKDKLDLTVTFSEEYDTASLTANSFKLEYRNAAGAWTQVGGTFTQLSPSKFRFTPNADLFDGVKYRVTVVSGDNGVKSKGGAKLTSDTEWFFWTVPDLSKTDAFDYGSGSVCPPSTSPCTGVEVAVFQVARNKNMVPDGKDATARIYLRWLPHDEVLDADELVEMDVQVKIDVDGQTLQANGTVKRPDKYTADDRKAGNNTVNVNHQPKAAFDYAVEVTPNPQTNSTPVKYSKNLNLTSTGKSPKIEYDLYFLKAGNWAGGVPADAKTWGRNLMTQGSQLVTDMFPVISTSYTDKGDTSFAYTLTGNTIADASCGNVNEVTCGAGGATMSEWRCVYSQMQTLLGGHKFVAVVVPNNLCNGATAFAIGGDVFMAQYGANGNDGTVAHEIGHIYDLSPANNPNNKHRNDSTGVEGYQPRTGVNRSRTENPDKSISLMHTTLQPTGTQWIHNDDYVSLQGHASFTAAAQLQSTAGPYLVISGVIQQGPPLTASLNPTFLQEVPNSLPDPSGACEVALLDASNNVLETGTVKPGVELDVDKEEDSTSTEDQNGYFSVSLPWNNAAQKIQVSCGGNTVLAATRSAAAPMVNFVSPSEGSTISGTTAVSWTGSDSDSASVLYQLQFSADDGLTWRPLNALTPATSLEFDTTQYASGPGKKLRVMATDGFNTSYAVRGVTLINYLTVLRTTPVKDETAAPVGGAIEVVFASNLDLSIMNFNYVMTVTQGFETVSGTVTYRPETRSLIFTPNQPFKANTLTNVTLSSWYLRDEFFNYLQTNYSWSFTTEPDTFAPGVQSIFPADGSTNVELNPLIQVLFNEEINPTSALGDNVKITDNGGTIVDGTMTVYENKRVVFVPSADLLPNQTYHVSVSSVADPAGNIMLAPVNASFQTGNQTVTSQMRILGLYHERANDVDRDGKFDNLEILTTVEVRQASSYNLNARLVDRLGRLIEWQTSGNQLLNPGIHQLPLKFSSTAIRSNGSPGSYLLDSVNFYFVNNSTDNVTANRAYITYPYRLDDFFSILSLSGLPDQLIEWNSPAFSPFNLRNYTSHANLDPSQVSYSVFSVSDPNLTVTIDASANLFIEPAPDKEIEADVTILADDGQGNQVMSTFHVSVQQPRVTAFTANYNTQMGVSSSQSITVQVSDQWNRPVTTNTNVTISATAGTVTPSSLTATGGEFSFSYDAPAVGGPVFITIRSGAVTTILNINVTGAFTISLPMIQSGD